MPKFNKPNCRKIKRLENVVKGLRRDISNSNRYANRVLNRTNKELSSIHKVIIKKTECISSLVEANQTLKKQLEDSNNYVSLLIDDVNELNSCVELLKESKTKNSKKYFNLLKNNKCIARTKILWIAESWASLRDSHGFSMVVVNKTVTTRQSATK